MATTFVKHDGDGSDATWDFSFPLYEATDVKVQVDGVLKTVTTHYTVAVTGTSPNITGGTVTFTSGNIPPSGTDNIYIYRDTAVDTIKHDFVAGSSLKAADLDNNNKQLLYAAQEEQNQTVRAIDLDDDTVTTSKIKDANVTDAKISAVAASKLTGTIADARFPATLPAISGANLTNVTASVSSVTAASFHADAIVTNSEQSGHTANDTSFFTTSASDSRYFNISSGDTIKDGVTFPDNDTTIATTAAINDRIIDLVDDVGGFVPIANETSFPSANPDVNNGAGTIVSIKALSSAITTGSGVTTASITNGAGSGNTVTITGLTESTTYAAGLGMLLETTTTSGNGSSSPPRAYTFHRQVPDATTTSTVAGSISNVNTVAGSIANVNTVAGNNSNVTTVAGNNSNITTVAGVSANVTTVAGISSNVTTVAGISSNVTAVAGDATDIGTVAGKATEIGRLGTADAVSDMNTLGTSSNVTNMNTVAGSIASVNTCASNLTSVANYGDQYQVASSAPSADGGGNSLAAGDLYFNTSSNELQVYSGSAWQGGVTATGNLVSTAGSTMTGDLVMDNESEIRFEEATANGNNYIAVKAPASLSADVTFTLPTADGSNGQAIITNGSGALSWATVDSGSMPITGGNFTGDVQLNAQKDLRFADSDSSNYVAFQAPATISSNVTWTLPSADGSANQHLKTDGSGNLGWVTDSTTDSSKMPLTGGTFSGNISYANRAATRYFEDSGQGTNYIGLRAPASVSSDITFILPAADGSANQLLTTDGSGNLSFADAAAAGATGGGNDEIFVENERTVTTSYSITATKNAHSVGPIAVNSSAVVTIPENSTWMIV